MTLREHCDQRVEATGRHTTTDRVLSQILAAALYGTPPLIDWCSIRARHATSGRDPAKVAAELEKLWRREPAWTGRVIEHYLAESAVTPMQQT